jgi:AcrR family transcriptional regulator
MRLTREETKERNRRALLDAALRTVSRDGYQARLEDIAERAGLTTGAIYSLFGSKDGLITELVTRYLRPHYAEIERAVPAGLPLLEAVAAFARYYRRTCDGPGARSGLSLQLGLLDMALRTSDPGAQLAPLFRMHEEQLVALFTGRAHGGGTVTPGQAKRLAVALGALFVGLGQGVVLGLAPDADEQYFADAAVALVSGGSLLAAAG